MTERTELTKISDKTKNQDDEVVIRLFEPTLEDGQVFLYCEVFGGTDGQRTVGIPLDR